LRGAAAAGAAIALEGGQEKGGGKEAGTRPLHSFGLVVIVVTCHI